jgi:toxin ParE1/3/4
VTSTERPWRVGLSNTAGSDFRSIVLWTAERYGPEQARIYAEALRATLASLAKGPSTPGARLRPEIAEGIHSLHVTRIRRRARHLVFFRVVGDRQIEIARILHDGMDFRRHLLPDEPGET